MCTVTALKILVVDDLPQNVKLLADLLAVKGYAIATAASGAEALDALQQIVNTAFRRELDGDRSFVVDCLGYRRGKDAELQQMLWANDDGDGHGVRESGR